MSKSSGRVNISGKEYKTVALRVSEFREAYPISAGWGIFTNIEQNDEKGIVISAAIRSNEGQVVATGYAEEQRGTSQINRTSALENCETSAIGRALAAAGYGGSEYASANEVENAVHQQAQPKAKAPVSRPAETANDGRTLVQRITDGIEGIDTAARADAALTFIDDQLQTEELTEAAGKKLVKLLVDKCFHLIVETKEPFAWQGFLDSIATDGKPATPLMTAAQFKVLTTALQAVPEPT